jgi:SAM-dependent methyltransferase
VVESQVDRDMGFLQDVAASYFAWSPSTWWGDYTDVRFRIVEELPKLKGNVLDVGCNTGFIISHAEKASIFGLDTSPHFIEEARTRLPQGEFRIASFYDIPWEDGFFDAVILCHVLEIPDSHQKRLALLHEANRVLKFGGKLFISTPNNDHLLYKKHREAGHGVSHKYFEDLLFQIGFTGEGYLWNPIPSLIHFLPYRLLEKVPIPWWKCFYCPSRLVSYIPGIFNYLKKNIEGEDRDFRALWGIFTKNKNQ